MSIATKLAELTQIRSDIRTALTGKGISASTHDFADFSQDIDDIQTGGGARLPVEYQEVEWVGSSGTQRIETGLVNDTMGVPLYFETNGISFDSVSSRQLIGSQGGWYFGVVNNYWQCGTSSTNNTGISVSANTWYSVKVKFSGVADTANNGKIAPSISNDVWGWGSSASGTGGIATNVANNFDICLFSMNAQNLPANCKIKDFIIYQNNVLVRHFVPCYRIADSVIGMYDLVNNQFYTNAGTGTFTMGADV